MQLTRDGIVALPSGTLQSSTITAIAKDLDVLVLDGPDGVAFMLDSPVVVERGVALLAPCTSSSLAVSEPVSASRKPPSRDSCVRHTQ